MKQYKILTIATSGAGKTIFLSSMFNQLSVQRKYGFFWEIEDVSQRSSFNNIYTQMATGEKWPEGTRGDVKEWVFTCCVKAPTLSIYPVCQFTYIDYPGGLITNQEENTFDFEIAVKDADAVLVILDGTQLLALIENRDVSKWLLKDLTIITHIIQKCGNIPVHFIISKWDLLHNRKYSLQEVKKCLLENSQEFKDVVEIRKKTQPMRLIPVSSIGMEFATLQSDGSMKKFYGRTPQPYQLEVPVTYAITDLIEKELKEILKRLNQENDSLDEKLEEILKGLNQKNDSLDEKLEEILEGLNQGSNINKKQLKVSINPAKINPLEEERGSGYEIDSNEIKSYKTALKHAIKCFKQIQEKFVQDFPASDLRE